MHQVRPVNSNSILGYNIGFLLMPEFTMVTFANALAVLRMANRQSGKEFYRWITFTETDETVVSSDGIPIAPTHSFADMATVDLLIVCGGYNVKKHTSKPLLQKLRTLGKNRKALGSLCTGTYVLAAAGLLDGFRCTIHWENEHSLREDFPSLGVCSSVYVIDRNRYTCSSGSTSIDMMLKLVSEHHPKALVQQIVEQFGYERIRTDKDPQRTPLCHLVGANQPKLTEVVALMEANTEEPLTLDEVAAYAGISRRHLERLFHNYLNCAPSRYYMQLRLQRARLLLLQTSIPIIEIAISCGFNTAPHFSKCYSQLFGNPPREERRAVLRQ